MKAEIELVFRKERAAVLATVARLTGELDIAEDAVQEAFSAAVEQWQYSGMPRNPRGWLIQAAKFKAIDELRKRLRMAACLTANLNAAAEVSDGEVRDAMLRLIFMCCHPRLPKEGQIALTLREVCGLTTEEIAAAFLTSAPTVAQRIVRAKAKIKKDRLPYEVPSQDELQLRSGAVLKVIYLVFNEGYFASSGETLLKQNLIDEALRLGRIFLDAFPHPEVEGLLSLMTLQASRSNARFDAKGDIVLLPNQDRSKWNREMISEGLALSVNAGLTGPYAIQAAIAAQHSQSATSKDTDWETIVRLYDRLLSINPSPVVELNRAVAVGEWKGPSEALSIIDGLLSSAKLASYSFASSARAEFLCREGKYQQAQEAYQTAFRLSDQSAEKRFLKMKIEECRLQVAAHD